MAHVWAMHGVSCRIDHTRLVDRFVADEAAYAGFLASSPPFVSLEAALAGEGTALTIDDATHGSARAARLALQHGHMVTLFVNPGQVESGAPYSLAALSSLLDQVEGASVEWGGERYATATLGDRLVLRSRIKAHVFTLPDEPARLAIVTELARRCGVTRIDVPEHLGTLSADDVLALRDAGVDVQNHGWSHAQHGHLSPEQSAREVRDGRIWLEQTLGIETPYFAVPFGDALPSDAALRECSVWLTVSKNLPAGTLEPRVFNRRWPSVATQPPTPSGFGARLRRLFR